MNDKFSHTEALRQVERHQFAFWEKWTPEERVQFIREDYKPHIEKHFRTDFMIDHVDFDCSALITRDDWAYDFRDHLPRDWQYRSYLVKLRADWICAFCLDEGIASPRPYGELQAHHIVSPYDWRRYMDGEICLVDRIPDTPHQLDNLICLCQAHHEGEHPEKVAF